MPRLGSVQGSTTGALETSEIHCHLAAASQQTAIVSNVPGSAKSSGHDSDSMDSVQQVSKHAGAELPSAKG